MPLYFPHLGFPEDGVEDEFSSLFHDEEEEEGGHENEEDEDDEEPSDE